jgi:hypothetical protein
LFGEQWRIWQADSIQIPALYKPDPQSIILAYKHVGFCSCPRNKIKDSTPHPITGFKVRVKPQTDALPKPVDNAV